MIFSKLINKRYLLLKNCVGVLLLLFFNQIYTGIEFILKSKYSEQSIEYIIRIVTIVASILLCIVLNIKFEKFLERNYESLILLGVSQLEILLYAFIHMIDLLFLFSYVQCMAYRYVGIESYKFFGLVLFNTILFTAINLLFLKIKNARLFKIAILITGFIVILYVMWIELRFESIQNILMGKVGNTIFSLYYKGYDIRFILITLAFLVVAVIIKKNAFLNIKSDKSGKKTNLLGDIMHKFGKVSIINTSYLQMLRSFEYTTWKIFSIIILILVTIFSSPIPLLVVFTIINLIKNFYIEDFYKIEVKNFYLYKMSNYSYRSFMKDRILTSILLSQDITILLIAICIIKMNIGQILAILIAMLICIMWSVVCNTFYFSYYPQKSIPILLIPIVIIASIIGLNFVLAYYNYKKGENKWNLIMKGGQNASNQQVDYVVR